MNRAQPAPRAGFSLVEVTLALGVASFCLVTVFGLLTAGLGTNRAWIGQTSAVGILSAVAADLRAAPAGTYSSLQYGLAIPTSPLNAGATQTRYFADDGSVSAAPLAASRFRVDVQFIANGAGARAASVAYLRATSPASAPPDGPAVTSRTEFFTAFDRN